MFTDERAGRAIELSLPVIHELAATGVIVRRDLHIVVGYREEDYLERYVERSLGDPAKWEYPYDKIAHGKAVLSARTGLSSREVQLVRPDLLEPGDIMYWGSVVSGNLVVACSGVQPHFDETIARIIVALYCGLLDEEVAERRMDESQLYFS